MDCPKNIISNAHLIKHEVIGFNCEIKSNSKDFEELYHYSREFNVTNNYSFCSVTYSIPFVCSYQCRSRILLYLDDEVLDDCTMHCLKDDLRPLKLSGIFENLQIGRHKVKIMACTDGGTLVIPHINPPFIEITKSPKITARLDIIGYI